MSPEDQQTENIVSPEELQTENLRKSLRQIIRHANSVQLRLLLLFAIKLLE